MNLRVEVIEYLEYCTFRKSLSKNTMKAYRIDLRQFLEFVAGTTEPGKRQIEAYITDLHKQYQQRTIKRKLASIKAFYTYLEEEERIRENPFRKIRIKFKEKKTLPRIIPRKEIEQMLRSMYRTKPEGARRKTWLRDLSVVELCFATGARVGEISRIGAGNVNLDTGVIRIMGKGGRERDIHIGSESVLSLLRTYYEANREAIRRSGSFFVSQRGNRFSEQSIRLMMKKYAKQAGIERTITPHMFRHSFATYLIEAGADISYVKELLGHSSIRTTQIYIHLAAHKKAEILRELHPRNQMNIESAA